MRASEMKTSVQKEGKKNQPPCRWTFSVERDGATIPTAELNCSQMWIIIIRIITLMIIISFSFYHIVIKPGTAAGVSESYLTEVPSYKR